jgi:PleD family two-component response regulator
MSTRSLRDGTNWFSASPLCYNTSSRACVKESRRFPLDTLHRRHVVKQSLLRHLFFGKRRVTQEHILLVEDDASNAEALKLLLEMETSPHITHFSQASDVLVHLQRIQALHPLLFLLTHRLPAMNALELYGALHTTEGLERVPAIILIRQW